MLAHNENTYTQLKKYTDKGLDCCVVNPCGSGKTTIMEQYIKDNIDRPIMIFTHQENAKNYYINKSNIFNDIKIVTYSKMHYDCKNNNILDYNKDIYIFDEAHYMGAKLWREDIEELLNKYSPLIVGFTATPQRFEDQGTTNTIVNEFFSGHSAGNYTDKSLQKLGVFTEPEYALSLYDIKSEADNYLERIMESDISDEKKNRYKKILENSVKEWEKNCSPEVILSKKIPDYLYKETCNRILVYTPNVSCLSLYEKNINNILSKLCNGKIKSYHYTYQDNKSNLDDFIKEDNTVKIKVLYSIDKIMETIHIDDLNILIMLRPSVSNRIITQQFGRINSIGNKNRSIVFDMVGNLDNLDKIIARSQDKFIDHKESKNNNTKFVFNFSYANKTKSIFDAIDLILKRFSLYEYRGIYGTLNQLAKIFKIPYDKLKQYIETDNMDISDAISLLVRQGYKKTYPDQEMIDGLPKNYDFTLTKELSEKAKGYIPTVDRFIKNHRIIDDDIKQELYIAMLYGVSKENNNYNRIPSIIASRYITLMRAKIKKEDSYLDHKPLENEIIYNDNMIDQIIINDIKNDIYKTFSFDKLTEREQEILDLRFGFTNNKSMSFDEIGKIYNLTRERIRQIEAKAIRKLRNPKISKKIKYLLDVYDNI